MKETSSGQQDPLPATDKFIEISTLIMLALLWAAGLYAFATLPPTIPTHFNGSGEPDDWGHKSTILILPVLATVIYFTLSGIGNRPQLFRHLSQAAQTGAEDRSIATGRMMRFLKLAIIVVFLLIVVLTYLTATGKTDGLGKWFLPLVIVLILTPIILSIVPSGKK